MIADALSILMDPQHWGGDSGFIMRSEQHIVLTLVVLIIGSVLAIPSESGVPMCDRGK